MQFTMSDYPYLEPEDGRFCIAFRLSEDDFLNMAGGLKAYTQHRLDRTEARSAIILGERSESEKAWHPERPGDFRVPALPDSTLEAMKSIPPSIPGHPISEKEVAQFLLSEHVKKVKGILDGVKASKVVRAQADRAIEDKANSRKQEIQRLARNNPYGFKADSQSAMDWAISEYEKKANMTAGG
jgi:hypothetical protein